MRTSLDLMKFVKSLYADEVPILLQLLPEAIKSKDSNSKIIQRERGNIFCPRCQSGLIKRNGTKNEKQRYLCKDCKFSFSDTTQSIVYKSKYSYEQWIKFIHCELNQYTLKDSATYSKISQTTAFSWRHKLYEALSFVKRDITLSGNIQIDGTFVSINLKGTKKEKMPRMSKKRTSSAYRGISHHKVCIMSAVDENDHMFFEIVGLGPETIQMIEYIENKINGCSVLISDGKAAFKAYAKKIGATSEIVKSGTYKNKNGFDLSTINGLHGELKTYLKKRKGISIKHLQGYLDMFLFKKILNYTVSNEDKERTIYQKSIPNQLTFYIKSIFEKSLPIDLCEAYREYNFGACNV